MIKGNMAHSQDSVTDKAVGKQVVKLSAKHIHESNLIEGYDDPEFDKQSMVAWRFLEQQTHLTHYDVCKVQKIITLLQDDLLPNQRGYYRNVQVWVGNHQPPHALKIPELMEQWLFDLSMILAHPSPDNSTPKGMHKVFEYIHPFVDGNGRTGRMLMWWHELKLGKKPTLILNAEKQDYYRWFTERTDLPPTDSKPSRGHSDAPK